MNIEENKVLFPNLLLYVKL